MTSSAIDARIGRPNEKLTDRPALRPGWLQPSSAIIVIAAHLAIFVSFMNWGRPSIMAVGVIDAQLVPEGDFLETEAVSEADVDAVDSTPVAAIDDPEFVLPPPLVMQPEAKSLAATKDAVEEAKNTEKTEKKRAERDIERASDRRETQSRRRLGTPGGRGNGADGSSASCLAHVAASLRRNMPASTILGPGTAKVTFHVKAGGGISGISVSASSPAHALLARRIVASARGPSSCSSAFVSQHITFQ